MTEEQLFIHCNACQAQVRLQVSAENLEIRFCPKCGASVQPIRKGGDIGATPRSDSAADRPSASGVRALAPQLLPGAGSEPAPFAASRGIPTSPKTLGTGTPTVQVKPGGPPAPMPTPPPVVDPSQHVQAAPIPFVSKPPPVDDDPPLPAIVLEDEETDAVPRFDLTPEHVTTAPPPRPSAPPSTAPPHHEAILIHDEEPPPRAIRPLEPEVQRDVAREGKKRARRAEKTLLNRPLWEGVYTFPFRLENVRTLVLLVISLSFMGLIGCAMHALTSMMFEKAGAADMTGYSAIMDRAALYVFLCLFVLAVFVSLHQAAIFLRVVEETSAGIDAIGWPKDPWFEFLGKWLFLGWVFAASTGLWAIPVLPLVHALPIPRAFGWGFVLVLGWFTFPIILLSTMAASAFWMLIHPPLLLRMLQRPLALAFLYVNVGLFLFPSAILAYGLMGEYHFSLLLFAGPVWAISLLGYGRVLGRVGFELMREDGRRLRIQT